MTIVGDGEQRRDFTYVGDVVEANIIAATFSALSFKVVDDGSCKTYTNWKWGQVYNIGTGRNYSINEIAKMMGGETINIPPRPAESRVSLANPNKAKEELGWNSKVSLEDWIAQHK